MKQFIQTKSFKIAALVEGDTNSSKLALLLPGRMDTKDYAHLVSHAKLLANKGFHTVRFDPPFSWESGGDIRNYTMTNYIKSVHELIEYFGNKPTILIGHSRGGSISMFAGTSNPYVTSFVAIMGKHSYTNPFPIDEAWESRGYKMEHRDPPPGDPARRKELKFKLDYAFMKDSLQYDCSEELAKCTKPKLFIAGEQDISVPPEVIEKTYNLSAGPKEYKVLKGIGHDYRYYPEYIKKVDTLIAGFIENYAI